MLTKHATVLEKKNHSNPPPPITEQKVVMTWRKKGE